MPKHSVYCVSRLKVERGTMSVGGPDLSSCLFIQKVHKPRSEAFKR